MANVLTSALFNTLIGMGTVFLVLIFISLIISLFVYVPGLERAWSRFWRKVKETLSDRQPIHGVAEEPERAPKRPVLKPEDLGGGDEEVVDRNDDALIAVIMAAIVASEGGAVSADQLVVRSIRRLRRRS